ncbi:hypothetical protein CIPAW_01G284900 [Carya illinoinensis]|uniref:Uncharacterized protein n=1 Tax=Carya illinoinensis TaxID=32201 RepID=A0A8T1RTJ5_CARIL|nr:hypothetical protein CIPAW_01G284900 [Carya illinoinensis]
MQKMKRKDIQICLLLAFVFIATRSYSATAMRIRKAEPELSRNRQMVNFFDASLGGFKLKPAQSSEGSAAGFLSATWVSRTSSGWHLFVTINKSGMQVIENYRKVPSTPNPIGNRHPPAKHD